MDELEDLDDLLNENIEEVETEKEPDLEFDDLEFENELGELEEIDDSEFDTEELEFEDFDLEDLDIKPEKKIKKDEEFKEKPSDIINDILKNED